MLTRDDYIKKHNAFSWEIADACKAFFAMQASIEWANSLIARATAGTPTKVSILAESISIVSNALTTHFFIAACRIREESRSILNLASLYDDARLLRLLDTEQLNRAKGHLEKSGIIFGKLKQVRGMAVAHIASHDHAFSLLKKQGLTQLSIRNFLTECWSLFYLLREPISDDKPREFDEVHKHVAENFRALYSLAWPLE